MVEIKLYDDFIPHAAHSIMDQAFACIEKVQQLMSFHDPASELSQINRSAFQQAVRVHPWTYAVLQRAQRVFTASSGVFDCTVANTLMDWELLPTHLPIVNPEKMNLSQAHLHCLSANKIRFTAPIVLDLGGIAKGFAIDVAIYSLRKHGVKNAVVNAGGDLRVLGNIAEQIFIRDPQAPQQLYACGELANGAIATSACYFSKAKNQGQWINALVNPYTRHALDTDHSFSVIAPNACIADALTKVVAITQNLQHPCLPLFSAQAFIL
ncbi:FAD:protein FMN transferase [Acinetobacter sichuanensis]|uniref:FAD:protein FMN transferase n=1 Tax=Acinetobacter sichuanensis TaxID=2136183 RepID=A0A371YMB8_9GAMM|nr:FAD:protein FMN transferase [Acinetobacter sichuanensis]RFC82628.1 FAD:protein FMN transferase [Acinetobacter sichuanensis]